MNAPRPANETRRMQALHRYRILDTTPEREYDDITTMACYICGTPIAFISLVDDARQWFKSKVGVETTETDRDVAFCAHTILQPDLMIVPDALNDQRFAEGPLTQGPPHIRFYAGMPLLTPDGYSVGALCVVDQVPRTLTPEQSKALRALGRQVVALLELRRASAELAASLAEIKTLKALLPICAYCKRVRDDAGYWNDLETYLSQEAGAGFTHGICPTCTTEHFGEQAIRLRSGSP